MSGPFKDGSGPAFPASSHAPGMTLRDWFAGQALAGLVGTTAADGGDFLHGDGMRIAERYAYAFADAMLEARE